MSDPDTDTSGKSTGDGAASLSAHADADQHPVATDGLVFYGELEAGPILADILSAAGPLDGAGLDDLYATITSLADDTFVHLDDAVHHLTTSVDLFDVPVVHHGDGSDHSS